MTQKPRRAGESDVSLQKKYRTKKRGTPVSRQRVSSVEHLVLGSLRAVVAGEIAGGWDKFSGMGTRLTNLANVAAVAPRTSQETAARLEEDQKWKEIARGRLDVKQIASQRNHPSLRRAARVTEDQRRGFASRSSDKGKKDRFPPTRGK